MTEQNWQKRKKNVHSGLNKFTEVVERGFPGQGSSIPHGKVIIFPWEGQGR